MGALARLWKGGTTFKQLGGIKMTVWQPFVPQLDDKVWGTFA